MTGFTTSALGTILSRIERDSAKQGLLCSLLPLVAVAVAVVVLALHLMGPTLKTDSMLALGTHGGL